MKSQGQIWRFPLLKYSPFLILILLSIVSVVSRVYLMWSGP